MDKILIKTVYGSQVPRTVRETGFPAVVKREMAHGWVSWIIRDQVELSMLARMFRSTPDTLFTVHKRE